MGQGSHRPSTELPEIQLWWAGIYGTVGWRRSAMWAALTKRNQNTSYDCNANMKGMGGREIKIGKPWRHTADDEQEVNRT